MVCIDDDFGIDGKDLDAGTAMALPLLDAEPGSVESRVLRVDEAAVVSVAKAGQRVLRRRARRRAASRAER